MVWISIGTGILSVLIWIQTVCKVYQHTQNKIASKERVNCSTLPLYTHPIELTLKALAKIVSENASVSIEANSVNPDQTAPVSSRGF